MAHVILRLANAAMKCHWRAEGADFRAESSLAKWGAVMRITRERLPRAKVKFSCAFLPVLDWKRGCPMGLYILGTKQSDWQRLHICLLSTHLMLLTLGGVLMRHSKTICLSWTIVLTELETMVSQKTGCNEQLFPILTSLCCPALPLDRAS